jgi:hypothetical protein
LAYLGNQPSNNFVSLKRQVITGNGGSTYTLDHAVASVNDVAIFVNNVRQDPASYSISGTALTLGGTISSSDSCYVIFLGQALQTVTPDANTITNAMLQSGSFSNITGTGTLTGLTLSDNILFNTASKGIYLGVTSATASNLLDDYEEGLHTVSATDTGGGATITMNTSFDQLAYTKIGRAVHLTGVLLFSSVSGTMSGTLRITLPFAASDLQDAAGRGILNVGSYNLNFTSGTAPYFNMSEGNSFASIGVSADNANSGQGRVTTSTQLYIQGTYFTDA